MELGDRPRLRVLSDRFTPAAGDREPWRVAHPLPEVLLLVVCGTIGACDDFDEIVEWGEDNLDFLRRFLPYHHGLPSTRWLRILMNRIDAELFSEIFVSWATALRPEAPALVALDGKTSRGSLDRGGGRAALHLVSAFATRERLVIGQEAVGEGGREQATILYRSNPRRLQNRSPADGAFDVGGLHSFDSRSLRLPAVHRAEPTAPRPGPIFASCSCLRREGSDTRPREPSSGAETERSTHRKRNGSTREFPSC